MGPVDHRQRRVERARLRSDKALRDDMGTDSERITKSNNNKINAGWRTVTPSTLDPRIGQRERGAGRVRVGEGELLSGA